MGKPGAPVVRRFMVDFEVANYIDLGEAERGKLDPAKVRRVKIQGVVDSGAVRLVLPESIADQLGLTANQTVTVHYADRRRGKRPLVEGVYLELLGRHSVFNAIVEPKRETALIGAIVLEDLDFLVDCTNQCLVPRDPEGLSARLNETCLHPHFLSIPFLLVPFPGP